VPAAGERSEVRGLRQSIDKFRSTGAILSVSQKYVLDFKPPLRLEQIAD